MIRPNKTAIGAGMLMLFLGLHLARAQDDTATSKLAAANAAYQARQYPQAVDDIEQNRGLFTEPSQQVEALFVLAQARFAIDGDKPDSNTLKDLALAYMRVVTFGSKLTGQPHVAESLYQTAQIEEKLKEPQVALALYQQLVRDKAFADSPAAVQAKTAIDRLNKDGK